MELQRQHIQQQLVANVVIDQCRRCDKIIFRDSWRIYHRTLWFSTPFFRGLFFAEESKKGWWGTGDLVMYEVGISAEALTIDCTLFMYDGCSPVQVETGNKLLDVCGKVGSTEQKIVLHSWKLLSAQGVDQLLVDFCSVLDTELPAFELSLNQRLEAHCIEAGLYLEGTPVSATLNKYERDPKARATCLAAYGAACAVCGMEFATAYGPAFAGIIEIHHTKPLSEIGETYEVDPIRDLVPVCPNCHTAIHSKPGGIYTVEELKSIRKAVAEHI